MAMRILAIHGAVWTDENALVDAAKMKPAQRIGGNQYLTAERRDIARRV